MLRPSRFFLHIFALSSLSASLLRLLKEGTEELSHLTSRIEPTEMCLHVYARIN